MNFFRRLREGISTGGSKKRETDSDTISSLSSAYIALKTRLDLKSTGRSAICIKKVDLVPFSEMKQEIENFLDASKADFELTYRTIVDPYEYLWIIIMTKTLEDNVAAITSIGDTIEEKGFSDKLLASIFDFNDGSTANYLIYNYKLDKFYPFVPISEQQKRRDHDKELKIMSAGGDELPVEKDLSNWYPIWNIPI
ncbi:MAG: PspA-associated protein PspAB [Nitrososphaeraceae archaeon]